MSKDILTGKFPKNLVSLAIEAQQKRILEASKVGKETYWIYDIESGFPIEVTKEEKESYLKMWKELTPKIKKDYVFKTGCVLVFGTCGEDDWNNNYFKDKKK